MVASLEKASEIKSGCSATVGNPFQMAQHDLKYFKRSQRSTQRKMPIISRRGFQEGPT
jgi:hypothetical protein